MQTCFPLTTPKHSSRRRKPKAAISLKNIFLNSKLCTNILGIFSRRDFLEDDLSNVFPISIRRSSRMAFRWLTQTAVASMERHSAAPDRLDDWEVHPTTTTRCRFIKRSRTPSMTRNRIKCAMKLPQLSWLICLCSKVSFCCCLLLQTRCWLKVDTSECKGVALMGLLARILAAHVAFLCCFVC